MKSLLLFLCFAVPASAAGNPAPKSDASIRPQIAAFYFGNYHVDPRNEVAHGAGWTEWELVKAARPRWPGHRQPLIPAWGYTDEADPVQMAQKISAAADHGVDAFIFDWYYYNDGPFLQRSLEEGYLHADNRHRVKFAVMWANHNWADIHPKKFAGNPHVLYPGSVTRETFDKMVAHVVKNYFSVPSYWKINGCPYYSIFDLPELVRGLGGIEPTVAALRSFREATRAAGFPDLHLNFIDWPRSLPDEAGAVPVTPELLGRLGFASTTSYVWIHHVTMEPFPVAPYPKIMDQYLSYVRTTEKKFSPLVYHPNATMGWDCTPRTVQSDRYENKGYPFTTTFGDNTPENFRRALNSLKDWLETRPASERILTINAWNEWTEGSYLEPDTLHGLGYLEAIRSVFGVASPKIGKDQ